MFGVCPHSWYSDSNACGLEPSQEQHSAHRLFEQFTFIVAINSIKPGLLSHYAVSHHCIQVINYARNLDVAMHSAYIHFISICIRIQIQKIICCLVMNLLAVALWMSFDLQGFGQGQADNAWFSKEQTLVIITMIIYYCISITVLLLVLVYYCTIY